MTSRARARATAVLPALLAVLACYGPEREAPHPTIPDDGALLRLTRDSVALAFLDRDTLVVSRTDSSGRPMPAPLQWLSRDEHVATVTGDGALVATGIGATWIVVTDRVHIDSARVTSRASYAAVHAGTDATCALTTSGRPLCWGWNQVGSLGDGSFLNARLPVPVSGLPSYDRLVMGGGSICGLGGSGVMCWGYNGVGQLGDGTIQARTSPVRVLDTLMYLQVTLGAGVTSCAFDAAGRALCWGWNAWGQLLDGSVINSHRPEILASGLPLTAIATGGGHVCGLDGAGQAWCWGRNDHGQLGDGTTVPRDAPVQVTGAPSFVFLTAGVEHTCGRTSGGQVWCWGDNRRGQLAAAPPDYSSTALLSAGGAAFDTVTTTAYHTCALSAGVAWCWGENAYGQLGINTSGATDGTAQQVSGGLRFRSISAGVNHTCGITTDGLAWCWGANWYGALGDGTTVDRFVPTRVLYQR